MSSIYIIAITILYTHYPTTKFDKRKHPSCDRCFLGRKHELWRINQPPTGKSRQPSIGGGNPFFRSSSLYYNIFKTEKQEKAEKLYDAFIKFSNSLRIPSGVAFLPILFATSDHVFSSKNRVKPGFHLHLYFFSPRLTLLQKPLIRCQCPRLSYG